MVDITVRSGMTLCIVYLEQREKTARCKAIAWYVDGESSERQRWTLFRSINTSASLGACDV
jgi:hypothetical protein